MWKILNSVAGYTIPRNNEDSEDFKISLSSEKLENSGFQSRLKELPIRLGGLGIRCQKRLCLIAFIGAVEL